MLNCIRLRAIIMFSTSFLMALYELQTVRPKGLPICSMRRVFSFAPLTFKNISRLRNWVPPAKKTGMLMKQK